jgi:hypothetical protein
MNTFVQLKENTQSRTAANKVADRDHTGRAPFQSVADRGETVFQSELDERLNESSRVESQTQLKQMLNQSPRVVAQAQMAHTLSADTIGLQQNLKTNENRTGLPDALKSGIENLSGLAMDDVKVEYNSGEPAHYQALAITQGKNIHIGPGQERYLPHEAWHAVQQKQGRVQATMQMGGLAVNDDEGLEQEADVMGAHALQLAAQSQSPPAGEKFGTGTCEPVQGEAVEAARSVSRVRVPALPRSETIVQRVKIRNKGINGLTHLVALTTEGHIYNEDWLNNEREEVHHGDLLQVDLDNAFYSRRGINQEANVERDKGGPQNHLWVEATSLNDHELPPDRFVREEMLMDPVMIHVPRPRQVLDGAIDGMARVLLALMTEKIVEPEQCEKLLQNVVGVKNKLHISSAPVAIDLETIGVELEENLSGIEQLKLLESNEQTGLELREAAQSLRFAFGQYKKPKRQIPTGEKIDREALERLGIIGIDLGGTGLKSDRLDVNVNDEINDKNFLVLGDAMDLQSTFARDCVDDVIAELLPLVDMEASHSVEARIQVIGRVLAGVNYICPNGSAKIKFNDNSEPGRVYEPQLLELAAQYGFKLERQAARPNVTMADLMRGMKLLESKASGAKPSVPVPQKPPEALYRWFTFER